VSIRQKANRTGDDLQQDLYAVLGVTRAASEEDVEEAFQRLKPDEDVLEAYKVLSHPRRRMRYDCFGFRARRRRQAGVAPSIPSIEIPLEWYEAERGASVRSAFAEPALCAACSGRGYEQGVAPDVCPRCLGVGHLDPPDDDPEEFHVLDVTACLACEGRGVGPLPRCAVCSGIGSTVVERAVTVRVPPGLQDGDELHVDGVGRPFVLRVGSRPRDSKIVLALAAVALLCAVSYLAYLLLK
jgi:DnaJ-class molecular chaperone